MFPTLPDRTDYFCGLVSLVRIHITLYKPPSPVMCHLFHTSKMTGTHHRCFYRDLVSENCGDSKSAWQLWHALNRTLSRSNSTVLPSFDDEKSLANRFGSFFIDKIKKIRDTFKYTRSQVLHPDKEPPTFCSFQAVTETEVLKFIKESPSKTCSLDPCPTHIVKQCIDILLPSLTS